MLPHLGQGANQSIEDGMALPTILAQTHASAVPAALVTYERLRRERVAEVQRGARQNGLRVDSTMSDLTVRDAAGADLGSNVIGDALTRLHGANANEIATAVNDTVLQHVGDAENLDDDVTLVVVTRAPA